MLPSNRDHSKAYEAVEWTVREKDKPRLDRYLKQHLGWSSRSKIQQIIDQGRVRLNDRIPKAATRVQKGDRVWVRIDVTGEALEVGATIMPGPIWEDPFLIAVNKPAMRLVHPVGRTQAGTVIHELHHRYQAANRRGLRRIIPKLCHRLDRETSGLLLIAKTDPARRVLSAAFEHGRIQKQYLAIVHGDVEPDSFQVDVGISTNLDQTTESNNRLAKADVQGKSALTHFETLARNSTYSLVLCRPVTGRQNQIRVHLAHSGHAIVGDVGYGSSSERWDHALPYPSRALLHSFSLAFSHPVWNLTFRLEAPPVEDIARFIAESG